MKQLITALTLFLVIIVAIDANAYNRRKDYFLRPQVGLWFGPITPVFDTADLLETNLGGGLFFRYNTPLRSLKLGLDSSYQHFKSKGVNELTFVPVCANLVYMLPLSLPVRFQLKAGAGTGYVSSEPDDYSQWDPVFMGGLEISFPAGRIINIGLRLDYYNIYEGYISGSDRNGHVFTAGISLYFNM